MIGIREEIKQKLVEVTIDNLHEVQEYLDLENYEESNHNILTMLIWMKKFPLYFYKNERMMLLFGIYEEELFVYMPLCKKEDFSEAIKKAKALFDGVNQEFILSCFTEEQIQSVLDVFPEYEACQIEKSSDYVYDAEKLRTMSGKKLQKKRNHLNAFYKEYEGRYQYESLNENNINECKAFLANWKKEELDPFLQQERLGANAVLDAFGKVPYRGGCIRIDGEVRAFAIGTLLSKRMVQENIEKADDQIRGLYQAILKEFLNHEYKEIELVNREDDMGYKNLRAAKMSYNPLFMIKKYRLCRCKEEAND